MTTTSKQRRERQREKLRQGILSAARQIAADEGWQALTMRKVADRIEYTPPTIYEHFENKEAMLYELMREGFRLLGGRLRAACSSTDDPRERLLRVSDAYCEFAWEHTELYQVMHGTSGAYCGTAPPPPELHELAGAMRDTVTAATGLTENDTARLYEALDIYRGILHGLVSLTLEGIMQGGRERAKALIARAVLDWQAGWLK